MSELDIEDPRVLFIASYVLTVTKQKPDKFMKTWQTMDTQNVYEEFWKEKNKRTIFVYLSPAGSFTSTAKWPAQHKANGCYFVKKEAGVIPKEITTAELTAMLIFGDMSIAPIEQLSQFVDEVLLPLFTNDENQKAWPKVVSEDVLRNVEALKSKMFMVSGHVQGKTMLPLPSGAESPQYIDQLQEGGPNEYKLIHAIETVVIEWVHQLRDVLKTDPTHALLDGHHPTPALELKFWQNKRTNLECIYDQLCNPKVTQMALLLEKKNSSYNPVFKSVFRDTVAALAEARDICLYLTPVRYILEEMETMPFDKLGPHLRPLMKTICLVWANSEYFNTPTRIIVFMQEICNLFIEMARGMLEPNELLKGEADETLIIVQKALKVLHAFRNAYTEHQAILHTFFKPGEKPVEWSFPPSMIFARYDKFVDLLETVEDLLCTNIEFQKLEKVELGGVSGKALSAQVGEIFEDFNEGYRVFTDGNFDCLSTDSDEFMTLYNQFQEVLNDMDRRMSTIIRNGFEDCVTLESVFKLVLMMGNFLDRKLIRKDFECKYDHILKLVSANLDETQVMMDKHFEMLVKDNWAPVHMNMPQVTGNLRWAAEIKDRITIPVKQFQALHHPSTQSEEAGLMYEKYESMMKELNFWEEKQFKHWGSGVDQACRENLALPLLKRSLSTNALSVNFDPELVAVLRETHYLTNIEREDIPASALQIYQDVDMFRKYVANLDMMVRWYNKIRATILEVEFPLIEGELQELDQQLKQGETSLLWKSSEAWQYIETMRDKVHDLEQRVQKARDNDSEIQNLMTTWTKTPLYERREEKKSRYLDLIDREERCNKRYQEISAAGDKIHELIEENRQLFKAEEDTEMWQAYMEYVDEYVVDGFFNTMLCSFHFLLENTDKNNVPPPLFLAKMELQVPEIVYIPSMDMRSVDGFYSLIDSLLGDVTRQASCIKRVASHTGSPHYQQDMEDMSDLGKQRAELLQRAEDMIGKAIEYRSTFNKYSYLWTDDRQDIMRQFLQYNHALTAEEFDLVADGQMPECAPTLSQFKYQIDSYEAIYLEAETIEAKRVIDGWFRINASYFKQGLLNTIKQWSLMFKQHLVDHVTNSLAELSTFITEADAGMNVEIKRGDYDGLIKIMQHLNRVRERILSTDAMFEPLKQTIQLLKTYGMEMPEEIHQQLVDLPDKWANTKKLSITMKQQVAPLIANEVLNITRKVSKFDVSQHKLREDFRSNKAFKFSCDKPYEILDKVHSNIKSMEKQSQALSESARMFDVSVPDFKQIRQCRKEVRHLKVLWDIVHVVNSTFQDWNSTPWKDINVEIMDQDCKKFAKDVRVLDKEMRAWNVFTGLESTIKNMMTALRAVGDLQNSSIRERHWKQLMDATGVQFTMDENTVLEDLLQLNLHKYEDEVKNIVDKAVKETSMERVLRELEVTWAQMDLDHEKHPRTGITIVRANEELIDQLENDQNQVQTMMGSKYIAFFRTEVSEWSKKLSTADQVITTYMEVQRTWSHLESIFIGSEDIRSQLPEDSKRFDGIDEKFKLIVKDVEKTKNCILATNQPRLYERLEELQSQLALCEKALAEYLETKRLAFPRFYFVSSVDLLDILSNGNNPVAVMKHLTKLFDSMAKLTLQKDNAGNPIKVATAMTAKDGELVNLDKPCDLNGPVELWLNNLLKAQCSTVRHEMSEAVSSYEEKPRDQWVFDYPAQVALCGTQIWWTVEVNTAFGRLEEGQENALKDYNKKQVTQLNNLINMLIGELSAGDRQKIMTICTIDVHARDVVSLMIHKKVENSLAFLWLSQLRHRWDESKADCFANICDAQFQYSHEYLGNNPRLVITPLTDRCYITLTQSLHLIMGGAPAGPAGTGKTETTKDLGRALGMMVYVFNCSEQMDYKSVGNIYKGLAQSGAWGCFDEFNRIAVEVLSVISVQVKSIQDAIKEKKARFNFMGEEIALVRHVGLFITMNPGYAGRTELPENLKALFRPCAMVVPDFALISEIMMVAEGFLEARLLARKFITLYTLCKELLSKQDHYDWGLRAIKSVLVVAGTLKRGDRQRPEDQVLMRALRDFNVPKIVVDDLPVFMGLIGDLFPALDVPRKRNMEFEKNIRQATLDLSLQPEDNFILKCVQLQELFDVRHSVFLLGPAGAGKSRVWTTLQKTFRNLGRKPVSYILDPKSVSNDELFGVINSHTREWRDGLFSVGMRDLANMTGDGPKWIVLDGDIDPMWIESLNTVMDDNKILTLASNERIPLNPSMRLLFEISHLRTATPATVSRAGILFINSQDLGWNPYVQSWIETREVEAEKANLTVMFDKYVPPLLDVLRTRFKKITPMVEIAHVQILCALLDCHLTPENMTGEGQKELLELYFVFCCIWAFGGCLFQDQLTDGRVEFSKWWLTEMKGVKFPTLGTLFDYFIDPETHKFEPWSKNVAKFELDPDVPLQAALVHTVETTRIRYFMNMLLEKGYPVMLVGLAGTGKTVIMQDKLTSFGENWVIANVPFNYYTTSEMLQRVLEKPLEKKAGRNYGPVGNKRLIYFVDDLNMPEVDQYFTVQPHTFMRQHVDHHHWYDRHKLTVKDIHNTQYVACMNPTAGSFTIDSRLQRHFAVFAVSFPNHEALQTIYTSILQQHLAQNSFPLSLQRFSTTVVNGSLALHHRISSTFLPTAIKFHYIFNLRDLSNIFQGLLFAGPECAKNQAEMIRLWMHEATRVYRDKMVDVEDMTLFDKLLKETIKKSFDDMDMASDQPSIYCHFAEGVGEPKYLPISDWSVLNKLLTDALENYNELNAAMNLVLFEDAMMHICRINRILESPRGNALLIGVGGSGKQSLSRLAASISSLEVFQITLRKGYAIVDLKMDLANLYKKAGTKHIGTMFLMTDSQVADEKFLVLINDLLASGEIPDLFNDDELEEIIAHARPEVKGLGMEDSRENCWKYFIENVRRTLKVVLCFSPVGATLRVRSRKFPAVTNCTSIDWFHEWPQEALISVSGRFLEENDLLQDEMKSSVSQFMSYVHTSVNEVSQTYLHNEKRYNYTTPKSFLEQINLYQNLLRRKHQELMAKIMRLENGLEKLRMTASQVDELKEKLASQEVELAVKNEDANKLIQVVGAETEKVGKEKAIADEEEKKVSKIQVDVSAKAADCAKDLAKAEPALKAAEEALNTLNKGNLTEMKAFASPPAAVMQVAAAVMCLLAPGGKVPKDKSWKNCKAVIMSKIDKMLDDLVNYDKDHISEESLKAVQPYIKNPDFNPEFIRSKSIAAAGLCSWVKNIMIYYGVFCEVKPKRDALQAATDELNAATTKLKVIKDKVSELQEILSKCQAEFEEATMEKLKCQQEADETANIISLANRLVNGLASENVRWADTIEQYKIDEQMLAGDVLLITAFVSYMGCFTKKYRTELMESLWMPFFKKLPVSIPTTEGLDPLNMLVDDAAIAGWNNEGLPGDRMSIENATILTSCERWPLMIDPQLQGIKWIKTRYGSDLKVTRLGAKGYLDIIESAVANGDVVLLENIGESIDPVLDPLLGRNTIHKGRAIKMGEKEVEFNPKFRLILQTKLANPHYKPEMQAQATLINFTVTRDGLEDQLLGAVVAKERPDLESLKSDLTHQQNEFKIILKELEDNLLARLSSAEGNFLGDVDLVENLETTKGTAAEIAAKSEEAKVTEVEINYARELYRPAAARASLLYFIMNDLYKIHPMYQFSLKAFSVVFDKAIDRAEPAEEVKERVINLIDCITYFVFVYTSRGLFERDKLIFVTQLVTQVLVMSKEIEPIELEFLLRFPVTPGVTSPVEWLQHHQWGGIKKLCDMEEFHNLDKDIEGSAKRWKTFVESECPEKEKFPQEWKNKNPLQKLCMMRCLRPDRMVYAVRQFVEEKMGAKYVEGRSIKFSKSFEEAGPSTPVFFILSPGVDPLKDVEKLGKKLGYTTDAGNFHNISLGQGQEVVAEAAMEIAAYEGHWVVLQNVHLVSRWLSKLEKTMEVYSEEGHENYRLFVSAEPAASAEYHIIPQGILESAIKITNEPPTGMHANLHKALDNFNQDTLEMCAKETEFKAILFSLCYFHAVVCERRKFGPQGWNRVYPYNMGDLTISVSVLFNYLEGNNKVPWEDLRYLFGEIMYGGHITDDWDRRLCRTYLEVIMDHEMLDGELLLAPGFPVPPNMDYQGFHRYIDEELPPESPVLYGLHPNAEIEFLTTQSENLFRVVLEMQPRDTGSGGGAGVGREEKVKALLDEILDHMPDEFNMTEMMGRVPPEDRTPYVVVAFQECERMNMLTSEMRRSLKELNLGLKGELTITSDMEELGNSLFLDHVPANWTKRAYPSLLPLGLWYADLLSRVKELESWVADFHLPAAVWLAGFFNPQSFLTAIMQQMARKNEWPLDRMVLQCDVTKKVREDMAGAPRDGAYVFGLYMEGARWDSQSGMIAESRLKELAPPMPVIFIRAIPVDRQDLKNMYDCPVYKTKMRGPTFVWTFNLRSKEKPSKWTLAGVALLLQM